MMSKVHGHIAINNIQKGNLNFQLTQVDQDTVGSLVLRPTIMILNVTLNVTKEGLIKASLSDID